MIFDKILGWWRQRGSRKGPSVLFWVRKSKLESGEVVVEGDCSLCEQFPCLHVTEQGYFASDLSVKFMDVGQLRVLRQMALDFKQGAQVLLDFDSLKFPGKSVQSLAQAEVHGQISEVKRKVAFCDWLLGELEKLDYEDSD